MNSENFDCQAPGLYVHIPFCDAKCRYCGFYSEPVKNYDPARLVSAIIAELSEKRGQEPFFTLYIGGGSPSCLPEDELLRLVNCLPKAGEFTIEVNPGQVGPGILGKLRDCGVNRLSIGAQSFNDNELSFLGRRHSVADIGRAVGSAKQTGFENIGLDLIFAIPGSTLKSWKYSLQSAIDLGVQHISAYALTYEEGTPLQKAVATSEVEPVDEETDRAMYEMAIDELENAGYEQYEISNFARPGFECKHNLNYWANKPYIGVGPAAGSYWLVSAKACEDSTSTPGTTKTSGERRAVAGRGKRTLNVADVTKYIEAIEKEADATVESETPDRIQIACETAVLNLRRRCGINLEEFKNRTGCDAIDLFAEPIDEYRKLGLLETADSRLFLTRKALPIADSVLCDFSSV